MSRWIAALLTALLLAGVYRGYSSLMLPLLAMRGDAAAVSLETETEFHPPVFKEVADQYFPDFGWAQKAAIKWQRGEDAFLFAETFEPEETPEGQVILFSPLALLWRDPKHPDAAPYRIVAQEGRVQFENAFFDDAFDFAEINPGRIIGASLDGPVQIFGPDELQISGRDFVFSEANGELTSYHSVQFSHGPTGDKATLIQGSAEGLNVRMIPALDPVLGKDMPHVAGIASINLRQNVRFDIRYVEDKQPVRVLVTSKGPFEYEFSTFLGSFAQDVRVTQTKQNRHGEKAADRLVCETLKLLFQKKPGYAVVESEDGDPQRPDISHLQLRQVHAMGREATRNTSASKMILESQSQKILANLSELIYDPIARVADLRDREHVVIQRGATRFGAPSIHLEHDEDNELVALDCQGEGQLVHEDASIAQGPLVANWSQRLNVRPDSTGAMQVVELTGETRMKAPGAFAFAADRSMLWLEVEQLRHLQHQSDNEAGEGENDRQAVLKQPLALRQAEAWGNVLVVAPELIVGRQNAARDGGAEHLLVLVTEGTVTQEKQKDVLRTGGTAQESQGEPLYVESDDLTVTVAHDIDQGRLGVQQVEGEGHVRVEQHSEELIRVGNLEAERNLTVTAVSFVAFNAGENRQVVTLIGQSAPNGDVTQPATVELGPFTIEGGLLTLDRQGNTATVDGPGRITFPIPEGLSGEKLKQAIDMVVVWRDKMTFDGQTATFVGAVQASTQNDPENISRVDCEEVIVELLNRVDFQNKPDKEHPAELKSIECRHNVRIDLFAMEKTRLVGRRHVELSNFKLDKSTGDFTGQGPGSLDLWSFGNSVKIAPQSTPTANRPAQADDAGWRYTNVVFQGMLTGNVEREYGKLSDDVQIVSAPVEKHTQTFRRHDLSKPTEQAANAAWIGCNELHMSYPLNARTKRRSAELLAMGNTELEAQQFHASADEIKFEELQGRFTLRGHGRDALLHAQKIPGKPWDTTSNRLIDFTPSIPSISVDGSTGINGGL